MSHTDEEDPGSPDIEPLLGSTDGCFVFLRAPMGLSCSGDNFCTSTDRFFSSLGTYLTKQVDDLMILATSWEDTEKKVRTVLEEARTAGCIFSIKKFAISNKVIVSGFEIDITDPQSGPKIGPDLGKIKALHDLPRPSNITEVRSLVGLISQLSTFIPDFAHMG